MRTYELKRETRETKIELKLNLDGTGKADIKTSCGFFRHMTELFAHHGRFDIYLSASGDEDVDFHHLVEDAGIVLGDAFFNCLGNKFGIRRYGSFLLPMDEALVEIALDISGRAHLSWNVDLPPQKIGDFDSELAEEFFRAFVRNARITLHVTRRAGTNARRVNAHHVIEAIFKGTARALKTAVSFDPEISGPPSTKGVLL
jgi:imidazoleglycerol-phosphate dehydratase